MGYFEQFKSKNGPAIKRRPASAAVVKKYAKKLPAPLIEHWKAEGFCGYAEGLLWFVNPDDLADVLEDFVDDGIVFMRSAFGDLFVWSKKRGVEHVFVHHGRAMELIDDIDLVVNESFTSDYLDDALDGKLFKKALKKLGPLEPDECYAFVPALALGGSPKLENIRKAKLREQLGILAELTNE